MSTPPPIVLNQSSLKEFLACQRLFGWRRIENLDTPMRRSAPEIGIGVHEALAAWHAGRSVEESVKLMNDGLVKRSGPSTTFEDKSVEEAQGIAENVFRGYIAHYAGTDLQWTPLNQEVEFLVEVRAGWWLKHIVQPEGHEAMPEPEPTNIWIKGRADNLSIVRSALWLVDYKTAGKMDPRDLQKYELDLQLSTYIYGLSKQLTVDSRAAGGPMIRVLGAIIDLLVKTKIPQYTREQYTRTDEELMEFELEFIEYASRIREQRARVAAGEDWKVVFPKNPEQCYRYGTCAYRDLCLKDTAVRRSAFGARRSDYVDDAQTALDMQHQIEQNAVDETAKNDGWS